MGRLLVEAILLSACVYNPRPIPPREPEYDEEDCRRRAKADYDACFASGRGKRACDQLYDGTFMGCLMYGPVPDGGTS